MRQLFLSSKNNVVNKKRISWLSTFIAVLVLSISPTAYAHQSPTGCNSNRLNISIVKDRTEVYQGQTLTYTVTASNLNSGSDLTCDITDATVEIVLPAADGTPTGQTITLAQHVSFLAGTPTTQIGSIPYVVNVNSGVTDIVAQASGNGVLHDAPVDHSAAIVKTLGTSVVDAPLPPEEPGEPEPGNPTPRVPDSGSSAIAVPKLPNTGS